MKKKNDPSSEHKATQNLEALSREIALLIELDLVDPEVERDARRVLATAREWGFKFYDGDLDCPECLACLHVSLTGAAEAVSRGEFPRRRTRTRTRKQRQYH